MNFPQIRQRPKVPLPYWYRFFNANGKLHAAIVLSSASDDEACELAAELLSKSECSTALVFEGDRLIYKIGRDGGASDPAIL